MIRGPAQVRRHLRKKAVEAIHRMVLLGAVNEVLSIIEPSLLPFHCRDILPYSVIEQGQHAHSLPVGLQGRGQGTVCLPDLNSVARCDLHAVPPPVLMPSRCVPVPMPCLSVSGYTVPPVPCFCH